MEFVKVPKGTAWLGGGYGQQGTTKVDIEQDFYLGKYEVTQEEWEAVTGHAPSHFSRTGPGADAVKDISDEELKRFPVELVSWEDCQLFIERLNKKEKDTGRVYRLPKEAEWEHACRGAGDKLDSAFDFYFSKPTNTLLPSQANFDYPNALKRTTKVGSYEPNVLGLHDMHGNVWEWCDDEEKNAEGGSHRVIRGGSWHFEAAGCRSAFRSWDFPSHRYNFIGFRLALSSSGIPK
jgi:formylglycine-generating enzyme required for sulfatase activity